MSADSIEVCPACYAREFRMDINSVSLDELNDERITNQLREYYEFYIDKGFVVADYEAICAECGFRVKFTHKHPLEAA